jgi:hypothetical protein
MRSYIAIRRTLVTIAGATFILCLTSSQARAQETTSVTDQGTPSVLERGTHPLGSFGGGEIDSINLFNGNLNLRLPLASKDGRAGLGASVVLAYNSKTWRTEGVPLMDGTNNQAYLPFNESWDPTHTEIAYGWSLFPGRMASRASGQGTSQTVTCGASPGKPAFDKTLTTVTFIAPDGTEYTFRDKASDGQFHQVATCMGNNRGRIWYTTDGTAATFVSDADIVDIPQIDIAVPAFVSGTVYLRDGTRFRIDDGLTTWQEDRNGNRINFTYTFSKNVDTWTTIDTLGRTIVVALYKPDSVSGETLLATITTTDATNTSRVTSIYGDNLWAARTDGSGTPTYGSLFGSDVSGFAISASETFSPVVVTRVELPEITSGSAYNYTFGYNKYGEVTRVGLPLGGRIEYEHHAGTGEADSTPNEYGVIANGDANDLGRPNDLPDDLRLQYTRPADDAHLSVGQEGADEPRYKWPRVATRSCFEPDGYNAVIYLCHLGDLQRGGAGDRAHARQRSYRDIRLQPTTAATDEPIRARRQHTAPKPHLRLHVSESDGCGGHVCRQRWADHEHKRYAQRAKCGTDLHLRRCRSALDGDGTRDCASKPRDRHRGHLRSGKWHLLPDR